MTNLTQTSLSVCATLLRDVLLIEPLLCEQTRSRVRQKQEYVCERASSFSNYFVLHETRAPQLPCSNERSANLGNHNSHRSQRGSLTYLVYQCALACVSLHVKNPGGESED